MFSVVPTRRQTRIACSTSFEDHYHEFEFTAMVKTLLLHGEMDTLFSLAAYNSPRIVRGWTMGYANCQPSEQGWCEVRDLALYPFLCLNVLYAIHMASAQNDQPKDQDYRRTKAYQVMLLRCTGTKLFGCYMQDSAFDPETFPHRRFFGVYRGQYKNSQYWRGIIDSKSDSLYGKVPLSKLEDSQMPSYAYMPTALDVNEVFDILRKSKLPAEIILDILDRADYRWQRRSPFSDDPMHLENRSELLQYLKYCWILLVRCDVLAKACGKRIDWVNDVSHAINDLFGVDNRTLRRIEWDTGQRDTEPEIILRRSRHSWVNWLIA
ncbi:MAG: hypothetical protein Q9169_007480 [Polycauliona sp. 2 TL-2023]